MKLPCVKRRFPKHYRDVIKHSGLTKAEVAKAVNLSYNRLCNIMNDLVNTGMDKREYAAIKNFVQSYECKSQENIEGSHD